MKRLASKTHKPTRGLLLAALLLGLLTLVWLPARAETGEAGPTDNSCPPGRYDDGIGCVLADPGHYVPTPEATEQLPCLPGTYQPNAGATSCFITDAGYYVDVMAAVTQFACAPGYYQPFSGGVSCIAADPGFYVDTMAATAQLACPAGTTSTAAASVACTPVGYNFTGFFEPVDMAAVNVVKAGRAVPIKFSLSGDFGLDILAAGSPISTAVTCDNNAPTGEVEETVSPGASVLSYDAATDMYTYVWKTSRTWAKSCRVLTVTLDDGSVHEATFKFNQ